MNRLVPYLDLFGRLDDAELARLAGVELDVCATLRKQVVAINDGLIRYVDLLPRLSDRELVRLTGASDKTIRFWRLCQPRTAPERKAPTNSRTNDSAASRSTGPHSAVNPPTGPYSTVASATGAHPSGPGQAAESSGRYATLDPSESHPGSPQPVAASASASHELEESSELMQFSGAPFPGFDQDDSGIPTPPPMDPLGMEEVEDGADPLGLSER